MFSMGGMTLGYFMRGPVPEPAFETDDGEDAIRETAPVSADEDDNRQDFEKAFLTPWHLFF